MAQVIVDAGPLVALLDRAEQHHEWTRERLRQIEGPMVTCDAVLTETCYLLSEYPLALRQLRHFLRQKLIVSAFESNTRMDRIIELMTTYHNVPMSFADACLVSLVESHPGSVLYLGSRFRYLSPTATTDHSLDCAFLSHVQLSSISRTLRVRAPSG